jgi:hypothetical protein
MQSGSKLFTPGGTMSSKAAVESANEVSEYKIRIFAQAVLYQRKKVPQTKFENNGFGITVPVTIEYDEFECPQFATNYNGIYIRENDLDMLMKKLCEQVKNSMKKKGLII